MEKRATISLLSLLFAAVFITSALLTINYTGSLPNKVIKVKWDDSVGEEYLNLSYENDYGHKYDLYVPTDLSLEKPQKLILFVHGGSFNSGSKSDGELWCKLYASKGYVAATLDYSLQGINDDATLHRMNDEIAKCVKAIKEKCLDMGIGLDEMAICGVSAGGTLAMNFAYTTSETSPIPVKFVFQLAAPTDFEPNDWGLLKKVGGFKTDAEFVKSMTGVEFTENEIADLKHSVEVGKISPARLVNEFSVPTFCGYGLKDHVIPKNQKDQLIKALKENGVRYSYIEFPNSNHGMYADLAQLQEFFDESLNYCEMYFE